MRQFKTRSLDFIEILPPSSSALKENLAQLLHESPTLAAVITDYDKRTGTFKMVIQGRLPEKQQIQQHAA